MAQPIKITIIAILLSIYGLQAQTLDYAIKLTTNEQFESADAVFKKLIAEQPNNGELYFYYGENFFKNDNWDMAFATYQKGVEMNATNPLCYTGLGKVLWYQGKESEAKTNFYKAYAGLGGKKNVAVLLSIAEAYIYSDYKDLNEAQKLLIEAESIAPKNPKVYILRGDLLLEVNEIDATPSIKSYEKAQSLDTTSVIAILRQGKVYSRAKNYNLALDFYKKANKIDSGFAPAYREKAEIYFKAGQYNNAVNQFKRYLELNNNCSARGRYAGFLNQAGQFNESVIQATEALKCDSNNAYTYRYKGRSEFESGSYKNGLISMNKFFELAEKNPKLKIIAEDYEYRAKLYAKNNNDSLAIADFKKALELNPGKQEINRELAGIYLKSKKYDKAIEVYKTNLASGKINVNDYLGLGRVYYAQKDWANADSAFAKIIEYKPQLNIGYLWRARVNAQQDPNNETWRAKAFYEEYIALTKPEEYEKNKNDIISAFTYMGVYYIKQKDICAAKPYFAKIAALDPNNENAKKFMGSQDAAKCP